jgi:hypothetical protein
MNKILILTHLFKHPIDNKYFTLYLDLSNWWWNFDEKFWEEISRRVKI